MAYYFYRLPLSDAELLWMKEIYAKLKLGEEAHYRYLQATLWRKIPATYEGSSINKQLVNYSRLTLLGILHVDPESDFIQKVDIVIRTIRELLLKDHKQRRITSKEIAAMAHLQVGEVNMIFGILDDLGFVETMARAEKGGFSEASIGGPRTFEPYLEYENMETLIIQKYDKVKSKKEAEVGMERVNIKAESISKPHVFIGHGRSILWARLKIFLNDDLGLSAISYESESRVGDSIVPILERMLDDASFAILILTAEDETAEGTKRARQNVIHEAGLFQGRLGFKKVVLLRQEGLEDFSNVAGLQYISFQDDKIESTFYELQRVLKREKLMK